MKALSDVPVTHAPVAASVSTIPRVTVCPLCHTTEPTVDQAMLDAGGSWTCRRCGQSWDGSRLAAVAAYAAWTAEHDRP